MIINQFSQDIQQQRREEELGEEQGKADPQEKVA
jgi:hypothetical protein